MKPTLFLSDLHLSAERPGPLAAFHEFAAGPARDAAAVYVLGDLFDWWIGDDQLDDPFAARIAASLAGIAGAGVPLFVARGNRDFLLGPRFTAATRSTLLGDTTVADIGGVRTVLSHGDELCTDDAEYQRYRARVRDAAAQARFMRLPRWLRRGIAGWIRRRSNSEKALKPENIMDVNVQAVEQSLRESGALRMIHGHTHRPARHAHDVQGTPRERFVLADWHDAGHVLEVDASGVRAYDIAPP